MNRLLFLLSVTIMSLFCSCETDEDFIDLSFEDEQEDSIIWDDNIGVRISKYMSNSAGGSVQGADCNGDYLFQFQDHNAAVYIYNMAKKKLVASIELEPKSQNHCNNVSFSNVFYDLNDEFPLLYVSGSRSRSYNNVQVYRILRVNDKFSIEQIQEIILPKASKDNNLYWTGVIMDNEENCMYIYANTGTAQIAKLLIPDIYQSEVTITDDDIIEQYSIDKFTHQQGGVIKNGKMFVFDGVPAWGDINYLRIIDLINKNNLATINITDLGLKAEPEGAFIYRNELYCATNNSGIYKVSIYYK